MSHNLKYNWLLKNVTVPALTNRTTYGKDLHDFGKMAFGDKFHGVYMADEIPSDFNARRPYGVVNLDRSDKEGSHWIGVAFQRPGNLMVYDSFGAMHKTPPELIAKYGQSTVTNPDAEQKLHQDNCGARVMAWLQLFERFGARDVSMI